MAKPIRLTKRDVDSVLRRHDRGLTRAEIVAETGLSKTAVGVILVVGGRSKSQRYVKARDRKRLDAWLAKK